MSDTTLREALLPCPFCGRKPAVSPRTCNKDTPYRASDRAFPVVRCCYVEVSGDDWAGMETAVSRWNQRIAALATAPAPSEPAPVDEDALVERALEAAGWEVTGDLRLDVKVATVARKAVHLAIRAARPQPTETQRAEPTK